MIISISGKKRAGKSTIATYLGKHGFLEFTWAYPIKEIIGKKIFGLTHEQLYGSTEEKEEIIPEWGMSAREIVTFVGTDLFRNQVHKEIWVKWTVRSIESTLSKLINSILVSDTRFPNELEALRILAKKKNIPFTSIQVVRESLVSTDTHASENSMGDYPFDYTIKSGYGDKQLIYNQVESILSEIRQCH